MPARYTVGKSRSPARRTCPEARSATKIVRLARSRVAARGDHEQARRRFAAEDDAAGCGDRQRGLQFAVAREDFDARAGLVGRA